MPLPLLEGIRIVDLTRLLPGPYATLRLAEMGAEVIKVEDANGGDAARVTGPKLPSGDGLVFLANHYRKRGMRIDLRSAKGQKEFLELVRGADIVMESFRPGRLAGFGLGYETLCQVNSSVILCSITGYGQTGSEAMKAGHDLNFMAESGVLTLLHGQDEQAVPPAIQLADMIAGMAASEAVLAALVTRAKTRTAQHIDISMRDALMGLLPTHAAIEGAGLGSVGVPELTGVKVCYGLYETKDGRQVALAALERKFWCALCQGVGHLDWVDAQFTPAVRENPVYRGLVDTFRERTQLEWEEFASKVDCCLSPVRKLEKALAIRSQKKPSTVFYDDAHVKRVFTHAGGHRE